MGFFSRSWPVAAILSESLGIRADVPEAETLPWSQLWNIPWFCPLPQLWITILF